MDIRTGITENMVTDDVSESSKSRDGSLSLRPQGKSRRMRLLEKMGCFRNGTHAVNILRATSADDLYDAFRLVHDSYLEQDYLFPRFSGLHLRIFEAMPETAVFIAKANNKVVAVTCLIMDTGDLGLPSDKLFPEVMSSLRSNSCKLSEITRWTISPEYRRTAIMTELLRACFAHAVAHDGGAMLAAVSHAHQAFYETFCFKTVGSEPSSSPDIDDPVILVHLPFDEFFEQMTAVPDHEPGDEAVLKSYFVSHNPYHERVGPWQESAQAAFSDRVFLRQLFVERTNFLTECTDEELTVIRQHWGEEIFLDIMGHNIIHGTFGIN